MRRNDPCFQHDINEILLYAIGSARNLRRIFFLGKTLCVRTFFFRFLPFPGNDSFFMGLYPIVASAEYRSFHKYCGEQLRNSFDTINEMWFIHVIIRYCYIKKMGSTWTCQHLIGFLMKSLEGNERKCPPQLNRSPQYLRNSYIICFL